MGDPAIQVLLERLVTVLEEKAKSIYELRDQVKAVEVELRRIRCLLNDVESHSGKKQTIKNWVNEMRQVACDTDISMRCDGMYNRAKRDFSSSAWIHVPKHNTNGVLCKAVLQLSKNEINELNEDEMRTNVANKLKEKRYLVVLDDVWTPEAWDALRGALPDENRGSRGLMTTRDVGVAKHADLRTDPYMLPSLNEKDSHEHELFRRNAGRRRRLEEVAMDYLVELVERSLIQPCKRNCLGQIRSCRVHDVLLQMLVATAKEQNFFRTHSAADSDQDLSNCRRLAVHHNFLEQRTQTLRLVRSFISFEKSEAPTCYDLVKNFKLLKVLDLEGVRVVKKLPNEIGDLVLLRYLCRRPPEASHSPNS
ncbi:putative late blight resistance protein-like protein [Nymphaea thermarum]|nr:putative late blight resistance protein-like protein [Nymphaea thermarum]